MSDVSRLCGSVCGIGGFGVMTNRPENGRSKKVQDKGMAPCAISPVHTVPQRGPENEDFRSLEPLSVHLERNCAKGRMALPFPAWHWIWH